MKIKNLIIIFLISMMLIVPTNALAASSVTGQVIIAMTEEEATQREQVVIDQANANHESLSTDEIQKRAGTYAYRHDTSQGKVTTDTMGLCDNPNFIKLLKYIKTIISLIMYGAAIALVIRSAIVLVNEITSEKAEVDKAIKTVSSKVVLTVFLFLLPTLFNWVFFTDNFITQRTTFFQTCIKNMGDKNYFSNYANK